MYLETKELDNKKAKDITSSWG